MAGVVDPVGRVLATREFAATGAGYRALARWLTTFGPLHGVGVEGTGSYGKGLTRHLLDVGIEVIEVGRPIRQRRRRRGKSDTVDAVAAALAVLNGDATACANCEAKEPARWR